MKTNNIFYLIILCFTMISCDNLSEKEKNAQEYMEQIATNTNKILKLPTKVDEFTFAEKVRFEKNTNTIIYSYVINKDDYGSERVFKKTFKQIESEQIKRAIKNQGGNPNYKTLGIIIKSIYKNKENDILYSFDINPKDYIKTELKKSNIENDKKLVNLFPDNAFQLDFNQGVNFTFGDELKKDNKKWSFVTKYSTGTATLNLTTDIGNPFGQIIEESKIIVELVLKYNAGTIKFKSKEYREYLTETNKLKDFDISTFFKENTNTNLEELQRYADYLDLTRENWGRTNKDDKEDVKRLENANKYNKENRYKYSDKDLIRLKSLMKKFETYFDNNKRYKYFLGVSAVLDGEIPNILDKKETICFRLFNDFEQIEDVSDINRIPTINKFKAGNVLLNIYLVAANTNGFYYNNKIKTINITEKWNNHFVTSNNYVSKNIK